MPYQEIQALGFPNSPRKLGLYEKPWTCISWYGPCTQLVNSNYRNTRIFGWIKTFHTDNPRHHYQITWQCCLFSVFMWWEDFQKISRKCVGWEIEGFSFRLNGWQQYYARNYEKKCKALNISIANISCERSLFTIITTRWRAGQLEKHVLKPFACDPHDLYGDQALYNLSSSSLIIYLNALEWS